MRPDVIVVGGGAAGIMASLRAAQLGAKVLLLEKTDRIGTKILISGGGKCNITHDGPLESVLKAFRPNEARFIRPSCYKFPPARIIEMLNERGVATYARADGRVFPVHQTAKDVVRVLVEILGEAGVSMRNRCAVGSILCRDGAVEGVALRDGGSIECPRVVLAVGGCTYPNCGTSGDGWPWAVQLGHTLVPIRAALAPISLRDFAGVPSGVALRDVVLKARQNGKEVARWSGDLLFTHQGLSGPCALGVSRIVAERMELGEVTLDVDLLPEETFEDLNSGLKRWIDENPKKQIRRFTQDFLPESVNDLVHQLAGTSLDAPSQSVDKRTRNRLIEVLKGLALGVVSDVPLEKGEVAAGGVALDEVDAQTMRSLRCRGLYLAGEVLDIAGPVGGYNLTAAWATGFVAGESAAQDVGTL